MAVVVCMRVSYSDPAARSRSRRRRRRRRLCWFWAEKFRSLNAQNERRMKGFLCCYVRCVAARWFESVPANRMDAQSKQVTLKVTLLVQ